MKKILSAFVGTVICLTSYAQLPNGSTAPDFTLTDLNGTTWNLYTLLAQGKTVFIDVSATWCGPCWGYHNSHALEHLWEHHGPTGTLSQDVMVFFIEGDGATTLADLQGTGGNTQGDWVTGTPYPICNPSGSTVSTFNSNYQIGYFPTIYRICPDKKTYEVGQVGEGSLVASIGTCAWTLDAALSTTGSIASPNCQTSIPLPGFTLKNNGSTALTSATIQYQLDNNAPQTQAWSGSLAQNATASISLSALTGVSAGAHTMTVKVINPNNATDQNNTNNPVVIPFLAGGTTGVATPLVDPFTNSSNFVVSNPDGDVTFDLYQGTGGFGNSQECTKVDFYSYSQTNQSDEMVYKGVNLSSTNVASLKFNVAYCQYQNEQDKLEVFVSTNCGSTWTSVYSKAGSTLSTKPAQTAAFTPTSSQWRAECINLNTYAGNPNLFVKFKTTNMYGNNLYIDDVEINGSSCTLGENPVAAELSGFTVYPNPAGAEVNIGFSLDNNEPVVLNVYNMIGELVSTANYGSMGTGSKLITLNTAAYTNGMYYIEVVNGESHSMRKLVVSK
jgi:hypothetical protein